MEDASNIQKSMHKSDHGSSEVILDHLLLVCIVIAAGISVMAIAGWVSGLRLLTSFLPDYVPMSPGAALGILLLSAGLFVYIRMPSRRFVVNLSRGAAILVMIFSLITLIEIFAGIEPGIEQSFFGKYETFEEVAIIHIPPLSAVTLLLGSISLLLIISPIKIRRAKRTASGIAVLVGLIGLVTAIGYLYGTPLFYGEPQDQWLFRLQLHICS